MPVAELTIQLPDSLAQHEVEFVAAQIDHVAKMLHDGKKFAIVEIPDDVSEEHTLQFYEGLAQFRDEWFAR